jgi:glycosyltransferase involved in cell wall biosynthesis
MNRGRSSGNNSISSLPSLIARLFSSGARRLLILPFEDSSLVAEIRKALPEAQLTILAKRDLAGMSLTRTLARVRTDRYDAAIGSLHESTVRRSRLSLELLLILTRSRHRYVRLGSDRCTSLSPTQFVLRSLPRIIAGMILGAVVVTTNYAVAAMWGRRNSTPATLPEKGTHPSVLFLRTDLAGQLKAGGSVSHIKGMIRSFLAHGCHVTYLADARNEALPEEVQQVQFRPIALMDFFDEFQLIAYNLQLLFRARAILSQYNPGIVYQRHSIFNFAGGVIARKGGIPLVLEANDSEVWVKRHWSRLTFVGLATRCEKIALRLASRVAVISDGVYDQLSPYGLSRDKILMNPNGVDPEEFHPSIVGKEIRALYRLNDRIVVGFIGTFTRWHGVETLYEAIAKISVIDSRVFFLLIGEGDLRSTLQRRAEEQRIDGHCLFTGAIPHQQAPQYLAACDILVSPHLGFQDGTRFFGSPTKLFEYMAMGKPIVASDLEQIGEVIQNDVNGLTFTPGNADQLADQILKIAREPQLAERLGRQARIDAESHHTWSRNVERILEAVS